MLAIVVSQTKTQ